MIVGVPKETSPGERRVALTPPTLSPLVKAGWQVLVEPGAGEAAGWADRSYVEAGARLPSRLGDLMDEAEVVARVRPDLGVGPTPGDLDPLREGQILVGLLDPLGQPQACLELARRGVTAFALELMPRITRAQGMDVLSSMATVAGYKAVLLAADALPRLFPMMTMAAGTIPPARVLVIGAGVAGLSAIATARRLGAVVQAYDVRPAVKEEVQSLGARFVELGLKPADPEDASGYARAQNEAFYARQREVMEKVVAESDVVITTAAVPGRRAPLLITRAMVEAMRPGSVIVDAAAERGGNCELTEPEATVTRHGVTILGPVNLPASVPHDASRLYGRNMANFLRHVFKDPPGRLDRDDPIVHDTLVSWEGDLVNARVRSLLPPEAVSAGGGSN